MMFPLRPFANWLDRLYTQWRRRHRYSEWFYWYLALCSAIVLTQLALIWSVLHK